MSNIQSTYQDAIKSNEVFIINQLTASHYMAVVHSAWLGYDISNTTHPVSVLNGLCTSPGGLLA